MKIAIDYTAGLAQGGGVGRYTRGLVQGLLGLDRRHRYTLVRTRDKDPNAGPPRSTNVRWRVLPFTERQATVLWQRLRLPLPIEWLIGSVDVYHSPDFVLPALRQAHGIVTIHDLSFLATPEFHEPGLQQYLADAVPRTIARADHVLADSEHTRQELIARMDVAPSRITVVYPGVELRFRPYDEDNADDRKRLTDARDAYELAQPFILSVGTVEPRKNYDGLLRAFASLVHAGHLDYTLVIAGGRGWLTDDHDLHALAADLGVAERVRFAGYVDDEMLPALYNLAELVAYPSHYEGFGLPVLEGMACGTPVVTAHNTSIPEVGGDAVLYIDDSRDVETLAAVIARGLTDTDVRETLRAQGLERARQFTWEAAARAVMAIYEQVG